MEWRFLIFDHAIAVYSGALALVFTGLGIWLALKLARPKAPKPDHQTHPGFSTASAPPMLTGSAMEVLTGSAPEGRPEIDEKELTRFGLSGREQEVLQLMAEGLSNQEIADRLFVSLNTIKTHGSRIFEKLDVKRRTQAVEKSKRLRLIK
jgi:NarL family two-component system response regulator LiaR